MPQSGFAQQPIVIAHRGASGYLPEHTLAAVVAAHIMGADYIEQDVVLSRDGVPVVLHDIYLEATTDVGVLFPGRARDDGHFYAIDFTLQELKQLTATERRQPGADRVFANRFPDTSIGFRIPTLAEEIELITGMNQSTGRQAGLYIEFKRPDFHSRHGFDIARITLDVLATYELNRAGAPVYLQCFDLETLRHVRDTLKSPLPLIMLLADPSWGESEGPDYAWLQTAAGLDSLAPLVTGIGPWIPQLFLDDKTTPSGLAQMARDRGLLVHPYTLRADQLDLESPDFDHLQRKVFLEAGADGAFSDFPDLTRAFIDQHFPAH